MRFTTVTFAMVGLLVLAMVAEGPWPVLALLYITAFTFLMDRVGITLPPAPDHAAPTGDALMVAIGISHFVLLYGGVWAIAAHPETGLADRVMIFFALSLFLGQISNSTAHELIHRSPRALRGFGVAIFSSLMFGFHNSAHMRVHHVYAATPLDPNTARLGESFYGFAMRAWWGALRAGYVAEARLRRARTASRQGLHPYVAYALGGAASLLLGFVMAGWAGVGVLLVLSAYAQAQLLLSDYVQHYGLLRQQIAPGKWEPVGPQHSWNAPQGFSAALMLNAPHHSDHHTNPKRPYPALGLDRATMPVLPHSLPVMAVIALWPPIWRRLMDRRSRAWAIPCRAAA